MATEAPFQPPIRCQSRAPRCVRSRKARRHPPHGRRLGQGQPAVARSAPRRTRDLLVVPAHHRAERDQVPVCHGRTSADGSSSRARVFTTHLWRMHIRAGTEVNAPETGFDQPSRRPARPPALDVLVESLGAGPGPIDAIAPRVQRAAPALACRWIHSDVRLTQY